MLVIGRALMSLPTLCVFDEPSIGMSPLLVEQSFHVISQLRDEGITILLIEQNVRKTLEIADRAYVLQNGRVVMEGTASALQSDLVDRAYLGI
jgi:branched-chain amino acid transport system ATP-binding protein